MAEPQHSHGDFHINSEADTKFSDEKATFTNIETSDPADDAQSIGLKDHGPKMRSQADDLSVWESLRRYKLVVFIAMAAAFSASLDGYQISLNGGIVSNKGFIKQFAAAGTEVIDGKYVSVWGGIQSAGQTIGQIFLQYATDAFGRKVALFIPEHFAETFATHWQHWLLAKLFSGCGVGMLQATMPVYLSEIAPTQLRGFLINAYSLWFIVGQFCGAIALNRLNASHPLDFHAAVYTQWAMIGVMLIIFPLIPETPWCLVTKGKTEKAKKVLLWYNGHVEGYNVQENIGIMNATIEHERHLAKQESQEGPWAVFRGRNFIRTLIASWPKVTQQFVGLAVFTTFSTYFFQAAGNKNPFPVTVILTSVQLLSVILTVSFTDSFGRRPFTVYPYAVTVLSVLCLGIVGCFNYKTKANSTLLVFFAALATFSTTGASAIGYAYAAEIPQQRLRAGWALAFSNLIAIMLSFCTPLMINDTAKWGVKTGFFFAGSSTVAVVIAWFILPEVARRTPAEIDELFEKKVNLRKFDSYVTDVQINAAEDFRKEGQVQAA